MRRDRCLAEEAPVDCWAPVIGYLTGVQTVGAWTVKSFGQRQPPCHRPGPPPSLATLPELFGPAHNRTRSARSINETALFDFGQELGGSAFIVAYSPAHGPFATFAATLERLHWSSPRTAMAVNHYLAAQSRLFALSPSDVCTDARALAASGAGMIPPGTTHWVAEFTRDAAAQVSAAGGFAKVLEKFEAPADKALVTSDNGLLRSLTRALKGVSTKGATKILNTLAG